MQRRYAFPRSARKSQKFSPTRFLPTTRASWACAAFQPTVWEVTLAIRTGDVALLRKLLSCGADPNGSIFGVTHLMRATMAGPGLARVLVSLLLDFGADVNAKTSFGQTALMFAIQVALRPSVQAISRLIEAGADINARSDSGHTALGLALERREHVIEHLLREAGGEL